MNFDTININEFSLQDDRDFEKKALAVFQYQFHNNELYRAYVQAIKTDIDKVDALHKIPFLPISFFKSHQIVTGHFEPTIIFESSKTTGEIASKHYVSSTALYQEIALHGFQDQFGDINEYVILALLPSYLERSNSSLVHMVSFFMQQSKQGFDGFYLNDFKGLHNQIDSLLKGNKKVLLIGVSFALLDFAEQYPADYSKLIVMETGGMKGRKKEITRTELHAFLIKQWNLNAVYSEYGMTELLSQAYAKMDGKLQTSASLRVLVRDVNDPMDVRETGVGALNFIDLANVHSCSFIATEDIGKVQNGRDFEVLGRLDHSALRGCSLLLLNE
jgi:hypothetical protein